MILSAPSLQRVLKDKGYKVYVNDVKNYNLNLVGIRTLDQTPNTFNDWFCVFWKYQGQWNLRVFPCTTDPGLYYLEHPMNPLGTAVMHEGQYPNCWALGLHKGYDALIQVGDITVIRDYNKDGKINYDSPIIATGNTFRVDCHRANANGQSIQVDKWSAGCQVLQNRFVKMPDTDAKVYEYDYFISLCQQASKIWGNYFTYSLVHEADFTMPSPGV